MGEMQMNTSDVIEPHVATLDVDNRRFDVTVRVEFDGIEYVGHLWFVDAEWAEDEGLRDHGTIPGRTPAEVITTTKAMSAQELALRYRRAVADKRRYHGLRKVTEDVLGNIRYLNKVAMSMRAGLLDVADAAEEIDATEQKLHDLVAQIRHFAGVTA